MHSMLLECLKTNILRDYIFDLIHTLIGLFNEVHAFVITFMAGSKIEGVDKDEFSS